MTAAPADTNPQAKDAAPMREPKGFFRFRTGFATELDSVALDALGDTLSGALDMEVTSEELAAAQTRIQDFADAMGGRAPAGVDALLAVWFARRASALAALAESRSKSPPKVNSLDLNAGFGMAGAVTAMALEDLKINHKLVAIAPDARDGKASKDELSGVAPDTATINANMERAGADLAGVEILGGRSDDAEIASRAARYKYASAHFQAPQALLDLHHDWFEYSPRVRVGGYLIIDQYAEAAAAEVSQFIDHVVLGELADFFSAALTAGGTLVLRKDAEPPLELHRRLAGSLNINALKANLRWRDESLAKITHELTERRKQVQIRNDKIERIQADLKRAETERELAAEKARSAAESEYAPKLADLDKRLAERAAELKALNAARQEDGQQLETARNKAQRLESELAEQARQLSAVEARRETDASRLESLNETLEEVRARRAEERAQLKEASEELKALRARASDTSSAIEGELQALRNAAHERELELARLSERLESRDRELDAARRDEGQAKAQAVESRKQADALDRQVREQDGVIRELQFKVQQAAYEADQHAETLKSLEAAKAELDAAKSRETDLRAQTTVINARIEALTTERDQLAKARDDALEAARRSETAAQEKAAELSAQISERDAQISELEREARRGADDLAREAEHHAETQQALEAAEAALAEAEAHQQSLSQHAETLGQNLSELEARNAALSSARDNEAEQHAETQQALEAVEAALAEAEAHQQSLSQHAEALGQNLSELEARNAALSSARDNEADRADHAEQALKEARGRCELLASQADQARALDGQLAERTADLDATRTALGEAGARADSLEQSVARQANEMAALSQTAEARAAKIRELDAARTQSEERAVRGESEMTRARSRIDMLVKADEAKAGELRAAMRQAESEASARKAAAEKVRALEGDLATVRRRATQTQSESDAAYAEAEAMRAHAARLEERLNVMEAQAVAPRVLLRRLAKAGIVRSLEIAGAVLPGKPGRSLSGAAAKLRRGAGTAARGPALAAAGAGLPALPPTPEPHDAGPPQYDLTFFVNYTFGGKTRYLPRSELLRHTLRTGRALRSMKGAFKGERCFVMGNGPSLNHQNLKQLAGEFTIGANYIYMNAEKMGFSPTIVSFSNYLVIQQRIDEILNLEDSVKSMPFYLFDEFGAPKDTLIVNMQHQTPEFSRDASAFASTQSTVTYVNLQLAYYLGFDEVCLIGCDNRYVQPKHGREGTVLTQEEDDPNHFTPAYFKGLKWQKGDTVRIEQLYAMAGQAFKDRGSQIVDCTYNGALEIFEKKDLDTVVRQKPAPSGSLIERAKSAFRDASRNPERFEPKTVMVTISPDLADKFGHHYNMDAFLRDKAHEAGQELVSLCSVSLDRELADQGNWLVPAFSVKSWHSRLDEAVIARKRRTFEAELRKGLSVVKNAFDPDTRFILYMYTGNLPLAKSLAAVAAEFDHIDAHIHHFYAAMTDMEDAGVVAESTAYIRDVQQLGAELYLGTYELVSYFKQKTGQKLNYLGDPSVTFGDDEVKRMIEDTAGPRSSIHGPARVFFPPNMNVEKGYRTVLDAAETVLGSEELKGLFKPILRYVPRDNTPPELVRRAEAVMETPGGEVLDGVLSDEAFKSVTLSADIIAITYTVKAFNRRMSGSLTDALMTAKPIVATRGTYVGDQVERFGCGEVFDEGDVAGLIDGLKAIRADYRRYHEAAIAARRKYFKERSWEALHRRLTD